MTMSCNPIPVKFTLTHPAAVPPMMAHAGDSGFDLYSVERVTLQPYERQAIATGLRVELPAGYEMQIRPTSGASLKTQRTVHLGTVDSGYRGECRVIVENPTPWPQEIPAGTKLAQGVIMPVPAVRFIEVEPHEMSLTSRGVNVYHAGSSTSVLRAVS